ATFRPSNWTQLDTVVMVIRDSNGAEHQVALENHLAAKPSARIEKLDVDRVRGRPESRAIDVFSRLPDLAPDAQVTIVWVVRSDGRVVAHETRVLAGGGLHPGKRRDRYVFSAPAEGTYDLHTTLSPPR